MDLIKFRIVGIVEFTLECFAKAWVSVFSMISKLLVFEMDFTRKSCSI